MTYAVEIAPAYARDTEWPEVCKTKYAGSANLIAKTLADFTRRTHRVITRGKNPEIIFTANPQTKENPES